MILLALHLLGPSWGVETLPFQTQVFNTSLGAQQMWVHASKSCLIPSIFDILSLLEKNYYIIFTSANFLISMKLFWSQYTSQVHLLLRYKGSDMVNIMSLIDMVHMTYPCRLYQSLCLWGEDWKFRHEGNRLASLVPRTVTLSNRIFNSHKTKIAGSFSCIPFLVLLHLSPVKRICVFEHSIMTNFNCACPAIQLGQGSGFLSQDSSWFTACMSEQRRFWRDCADAQARLNLRCSHRR